MSEKYFTSVWSEESVKIYLPDSFNNPNLIITIIRSAGSVQIKERSFSITPCYKLTSIMINRRWMTLSSSSAKNKNELLCVVGKFSHQEKVTFFVKEN